MSKINEEKIEVGNDILSYCGKCKVDSTHVVSAMGNNKISKVKCRTCDAQHNYRKPKSLADNKAESKPVKKAKSTSSRKLQKNPSEKWNALLATCDLSGAQGYSMKKSYKESSIIQHPSFGVGVVTKMIGRNKIEVQFEVGVKLLVVNRG